MVDLERTFDLVAHIQDTPEENYIFDSKKGITLTPKQQRKVVKKAIQAFIQGVGTKVEKDKVIQAFSGSADLPQLTKDVFNVSMAVPAYDTLWQAAFQGVPLRKGQLSWEIANVTSGITFSLIPEGGRAKFYGVSGTKSTVSIEKYGAGMGITWEMVEGRKLYAFVEQLTMVRARLFELWANTHYGLLDTACATNGVAWAGAATDPVVDRDIATLNAAYVTIGTACKDKGYGDVANIPVLIFAPPTLKARINQAMRATSDQIIGGRSSAAASRITDIVEYNIIPYYSWNSNITALKGNMVLPGNKIQNSMYLRELGLSERDIETLSELRTYWTAFGAVVGDTDQCAQLSFA